MLNQRLNAAREINEQLIAAERAIDDAVAQVAALTACMPRARMEANLAANVGHAAFERSAGTMQALIEARREIIATHEALAEAKDMIGLRTVAIGGLEYKGPTKPAAQLSVVRDAAA